MHLSPTSKLGYFSFKKEHLTAVFFDLEKTYDTTWKYGIMRDLNGRLPHFIDNFYQIEILKSVWELPILIFKGRKKGFQRAAFYLLPFLAVK